MPLNTHVVCVHADPDVRARLADQLAAPDRTVETVAEARAARARLSDADVVVSGHRLPDADGLDLLATVRERRPRLPFVLVPDDGDEGLARAAFAADATDYLPLDADAFGDQLAARVTAAIEHRDAREAERFRALIEHSTDLVALLGPDGTFRYVSPSVENVLGYEPADLLGDEAFEYVHEADREAAMEKFYAAIENPSSRPTAEFRFRNADGEWRVIEARGKNRLDDPDVEGFVVNGRDVTERRRREQELRTERALTEGILDTIPDLVYAFDHEGEPIRDDLVLAEIPGYSDDDLVERHPLQFVPEEDRDEMAEAIGNVLEAGDVQTVESAIVTGDGEAIPHEFSGAPLTDGEGNPIGVVGVARDISERKAREQELELYETMIEVVGDGVFANDAEGRYVAVNDRIEEITGYSADELLGEQPPREMVPEDDFQRIQEVIARLRSGQDRVATVEHPVHTKDGETLICETRLTLLPTDEDGAFRGTVGSSRDVTERKERERERKRQNERLEEFAAVVSHDLRNPLNVITGHLELARSSDDEAHLDAIEEAATRMEALITDLLSLARQGRTIGQVEPVAVDEVARTAWDGVDTGEATLDLDGGHVVLADGDRLRELFENLFRNAVEHGDPDVTVAVGPLADGFYVADDGPGIPAAERERILEHGYTTSENGTGLGLAIVESIVEAHDWVLHVTESDAGGARFEVASVERSDPDRDNEAATVSS